MIQSPLIIKRYRCRHSFLESSSQIEFHPLRRYQKVSSTLTTLGSSSGNTEGVNKTRVLEGSIYRIGAKDHEEIQFLITVIYTKLSPRSQTSINPSQPHSSDVNIEVIFFICLSPTSVSWDQFSHHLLFLVLKYRNSQIKTSFPQVGLQTTFRAVT